MSVDVIHLPIMRYHQGFINNDPQTVLTALGQEFIMFNGNYSAESSDWQAHMFLTGQALQAWPATFLKQAAPYENRYTFVHTHVRGDAAVAVTRETGRNRFRAWEDETVTWLLGQRDGAWRIVGFFIRDIRNPE